MPRRPDPEYLDGLFSHIQFYVERFGFRSFDQVVWLLRQRFQSELVDDNIDKVCKAFAQCTASAQARGIPPVPPPLLGAPAPCSTVPILPDYMQGWLHVRVIEEKKASKKPVLFWATLDSDHLFLHKSIGSSPSSKATFVLSPHCYVSKHFDHNTFIVFVESTAENRSLNSSVFKASAGSRVQFELTSASEQAVEMWINAFTCGIAASMAQKFASHPESPSQQPWPFFNPGSLALNSWNYLSSTSPVRAAADDICQWSMLAQLRGVDVADGYGGLDGVRPGSAGGGASGSSSSSSSGAGTATNGGGGGGNGSGKSQPRILGYLTVSVHLPVPLRHDGADRTEVLRKVAKKISERKAARLGHSASDAGEDLASADHPTPRSRRKKSKATKADAGGWRTIYQTHAVPLDTTMTWAPALTLELPRKSIHAGAKVCFTVWCVEISSKNGDTSYNFQSSINYTPKTKTTRPYILTRFTTLASDLLHLPKPGSVDGGAPVTERNAKVATVDQKGVRGRCKLSHSCTPAALILEVLDLRQCWGEAQFPELRSCLRPFRKTLQSYHFSVDSRLPAWSHIPTSFVPPHSRAAVVAARRKSQASSSSSSSSSSSASFPVSTTTSKSSSRRNGRSGASIRRGSGSAAGESDGVDSTPNELAPFFTPYIFTDSCDTLREYSVAGCDLKSLQHFTKEKKPGHWRSKSGGNATPAVADSFQKTVVMHERAIATHLTYLVPWKYLEFRSTELTKSVQASRDRYSAWTSNVKGSIQQPDDYRGGASPSFAPSSSAVGSPRPLSESPSGSDADSGGTQSWIQWMVGQLTQLAQLLQDYQDHAARYRHMFYRFASTTHSDLLSVGHETFGDSEQDRPTIERSPFRKSVWKGGFGGAFDRHVAINCHLQSYCIGGLRTHPVAETSAVTWGCAADHVGGFKHGGLTEFDRRVSENVAAIANLTKMQNRLSSFVGSGANGTSSKYLDGNDLESVLEDGDMASASRAVTDRDLERLRCEQERLLQDRLKRRDVCMSQIWTVVLTAFLDSMERISRWKDDSTETPTTSAQQESASVSSAEGGASAPQLRPLTRQGQAMCHRIAKHGFLIMFESLLSCWSKEKSMLEDLLGSTRLLKRCAIEVFRMENEPPECVAEHVPSPQPAPVPSPQRRPSGPLPMPPMRGSPSSRISGGEGHEVQLSESSDAGDGFDSTDDSDFDGSSESESAEFVDTLGASVAAERAAEAAAAALREDSQRVPAASLSFEYLRNSLSFYRVSLPDSGKHGHEESNGEEGLEQTLWEHGTLVARVGIPSTIYDRLPAILKAARIRIRPVLFSQGINEQHNMANVVGNVSLQKVVNHEALSGLTQYFKEVTRNYRGQDNTDRALGIKFHLRSLEASILEHDESIFLKHYRILLIAADIVRALGGARACNCKSGKDRTSMSVTLEQARFAARHLGMTADKLHQVGPWQESVTLAFNGLVLLADDSFNSFFVQHYRSILLAVRYKGSWMTLGGVQLTMLRPWEQGFCFLLCGSHETNQLVFGNAEVDDDLEVALFASGSETALQAYRRGLLHPDLVRVGVDSGILAFSDPESVSTAANGQPIPGSGDPGAEDNIVVAAAGRIFVKSILSQARTAAVTDGGPKGGVLCRAPLQLAPEVGKLLSLDWSLDRPGPAAAHASVQGAASGQRGSSAGANRQSVASGSASTTTIGKSPSASYLSMASCEKCFVEFVCVLRSDISLRPGKIVAVGDLESSETHTSVTYFADVMRSHGVRIANARQNIGKPKFAFNSIQRKVLPRCYAPPAEVAKGGHKT